MANGHTENYSPDFRVERTGSAGEKQIARMLQRYGVRYCYEHPVAVIDRDKVRVWYPDFWLPDFGVAIEYVGRTTNDDYNRGVERKQAVYEATGIPCVFVDARSLEGAWPKRILSEIRETLLIRLHRFDDLETRVVSENGESSVNAMLAESAGT
jgi:hypothetical protein